MASSSGLVLQLIKRLSGCSSFIAATAGQKSSNKSSASLPRASVIAPSFTPLIMHSRKLIRRNPSVYLALICRSQFLQTSCGPRHAQPRHQPLGQLVLKSLKVSLCARVGYFACNFLISSRGFIYEIFSLEGSFPPYYAMTARRFPGRIHGNPGAKCLRVSF